MGYHAPNMEFVKSLETKLSIGASKVGLYLIRREAYRKAREAYLQAERELDEIRKECGDHLLEVMQGIKRIEQHEEGET